MLEQIGFETFASGSEGGGVEQMNDIFGILGGQRMPQRFGVFMQIFLDFCRNSGDNALCLQRELLSMKNVNVDYS
jgi:hypothetical protein